MAAKKLKTQYNYDYIGEFSEGMAIVRLNGKYGFIDMDGKEVIPPIYDFACDFKQGNANVKFKNNWKTIDRNGKTIVKYEESKPYDKLEKAAVPPKETKKINKNYVSVKSKGKWGVADMSGNEVIPPRYNALKEFSDDLIQVKSGRKWGLADMSGKEVIVPKYDEIRELIKGRAQVRVDGKWGLIDESGNEIVVPKYSSSSSVFKKVFGGFIDESGNKQQFEWE